jgi:hypothetical protein
VVVATYARGLTACGNLVGVSSANSSANSSADQTSKKQVSSACKIALGFPCLLGSDYTGVAPAARVWWTGATASLRTSPPTWGSAGCRQLLGVQKEDAVSTRCLPPQEYALASTWAGACTDVPGYLDSKGRTCAEWAENPTWCEGSLEDGVYDPPSMYKNLDGVDPSQACCVCKQGYLPLTGTSWLRTADVRRHEPEGESMGEIHFCNLGRNALAAHSFRELQSWCTERMLREKTCQLTPFENRSVVADSLVFAGSQPGVLAFAAAYEGREGSMGHILLVLTGPDTLIGFTCSHLRPVSNSSTSSTSTADGRRIDRCTHVEFKLHQTNQQCEGQIKSTCQLRKGGSMLGWPHLREMRATESFFSGGLGVLAQKTSTTSYGVWACVKNWDPQQELYCGAGPDRLSCFKYEDKSQHFDFWGLNSDLRLVESKSGMRKCLK